MKLQYFGHITRGSAGQLALTVLEGIMEGLRHQGRPRRQWILGCFTSYREKLKVVKLQMLIAIFVPFGYMNKSEKY